MKKISDILNNKNISDFGIQKNDFDRDVEDILKVIYQESKITLEKDDILIRNTSIKIKQSSNIRFMVLLHLQKINSGLKNLGKNFTLEL